MSRQLMTNNELKMISGGGFKKFNRGLEYTTAGIGCVVGIASLGIWIANRIDRVKNPRTGAWLDLRPLFDTFFDCTAVLGTILTADSVRRIVSQAKNLY